ncbi:MAG: acylphosphatase [Desulfovibrionaceae bacterium]|nr:acylphosphatase [Desulfovibrionaceae bacterium]MDD4951613.1 acylphosphatase [Desulfovibrionaceae bacterium]
MRSLHCVITGKVQGVFFRAWIQDQAANMGVNGWVRNLDQDKVEILAQGDEAALDSFRERVRQGSPLSRVDDFKSDWMDYDKIYDQFEMRG